MTITTTTAELWAAVETFDAETAEIALARLFWDVPLSGAVTGVVLPFLREVGDRWEAGTLSVAHEHFVSDMLRRKLSALSSVPPQQVLHDAAAPSPVVLLACPQGERHAAEDRGGPRPLRRRARGRRADRRRDRRDRAAGGPGARRGVPRRHAQPGQR